MPNIKSAAKRVLTSEKRRLRNKSVKTALKSKEKQFENAVANGDQAETQVTYYNISRALDKAAGKGIIHKNMAARKKSRLHKRLSATETKTAE